MKLIILTIACLVAFAAATPLTEEQHQMLFTKWIEQHQKSYESVNEFFKRYNIFKANMEHIHNHNLNGKKTHTLAMNKFGDMTNNEFRARYNGYKKRVIRPRLPKANLTGINAPTSWDWRSKGAVTPVKNQGQCGSCWAFSTTGSMEGVIAIKTGTLTSLSEQELVDCSGSVGNQGCNGGEMSAAMQWVASNGGDCTESAYPYEAVDQTCKKSSCTSTSGTGHITGAYSLSTGTSPCSDDDMMKAVYQNPVSIAVDAGGMDWQFYSGGVLSDPNCGSSLDHGVLAVGYESGYYIVKNSWGADWGESGYIYLARGSSVGADGECGMFLDAAYPTFA